MDGAISSDGTHIRVYDQGQGPAILIVGPGMDDGTRTRRLAAILARRFRVVRLCRRQYQLDLKADGARFSVAEEVDDVLAVAGELGSPPVLYGHSSGGVVALEALVKSPETFAGAVIFEPAAALDDPMGGKQGEVITQARAALAAGKPGRAMMIFFERSVGLPRWPAWLAGMITAVVPRYRRLASCQIDDLEAMDQVGNRLSAYAEINMPTVLLNGDRTPKRLITRLDAIEGVMPNAKRVVMQNLDHGADLKAPKEVARVIEDLADRVLHSAT